jgi:outer membrane protease
MTKNTAYSHNKKTISSFIFFVIVCGGLLAPFMAQSAYSQALASGFGKDSRFRFSASARTGIFYGQSEEIVYRNSQDTDYLSQLLWDIKPLAYAGAGLSFSMNENRDAPGFYTNASFKAGIPLRTGEMEDRDWKKLSDPSLLTNYSVHYNHTAQAFLADLALGISMPLKRRDRVLAFLKLEAALSYMYFDWVARDGYYQYDETNGWDPSDPSTPVYGDIIAYYQHWLAVSPGIAVSIPIRSRWAVEVSLNAAPGLIWALCLDKHLHPNKLMEYQDYLTGGVLLESGLEVSYSFNRRLALTAHVLYRHIQNSRGNSRSRPIGGTYSAGTYNTAGAGFRALNAGLTVKMFF